MAKRKIAIVVLALTLVLCCAFAVAPVASAEEFSTEWIVRDSSKSGYTFNAVGSIVTAGTDNNGWNFFVAQDYLAKGDYTVEATIKGTNTSSDDGNGIQLGIVPWYVDGSNYVVVYGQWWADDRQGEMRNIEVTGVIGGKDLGWHDYWTSGVTSSPADGVKLQVTKTGNNFKFAFTDHNGIVRDLSYHNGTDWVSYNEGITFDGLVESDNARIGVYGNGDIATFSNLSTTAQKVGEQPVAPVTDPVVSQWSVRDSTKSGYTVNDDGSIVTAGTDNNGWNFFLAQDYLAKGDYTVEATVKGTIDTDVTNEVISGIVPWFVDANNYIVCYLAWESWDRAYEIRNLEITGIVNGVDISWYDIWTDGCGLRPNAEIKVVTQKAGNVFTIGIYVDGTLIKNGSRTIDGLVESDSGRIGLLGTGDTITFTNIATTANKVEHDFENSTKYVFDGENHWKVCADCDRQDVEHKVACSGGTATCVNKAVCEACGNAYGQIDANNHVNVSETYQSDAEGHWNVCNDCNAKVNQQAHVSSGAATETESEVCTVCNFVITPATGHIHNYVEVPAEEPTCQHGGNIAYFTCSGCSSLFVEQDGAKVEVSEQDVLLGIAEHDFANSSKYLSDMTYHWKVCANCDAQDIDNKSECHGGTATATEYPVCDECGNKYGYPDNGWKATDRAHDNYTVNGDTVVAASEGALNSFLLKDGFVSGNYQIEAVIKGTIATDVTGEVYAGIVPWYVDQNNYIVCYLFWANWDRKEELRNIEITGMIDGVDISWHDIWTNGCGIRPNAELKLVAKKTGNTFTVTLLSDGAQVASGSRTIGGLVESDNARYGVYGFGDTITFSGITFTDNSDVEVKDGWEAKDGVYVAHDNQNFHGDLFFTENTVMGNNTITVDIRGTMDTPNSKTIHAGFSPWYIDENNFILVYIEWSSSDRPTEIREVQVTGKINGQDFYVWNDGFVAKQWNDIWCDGVKVSAKSGVKLQVVSQMSAMGDTMELTVNLFDTEGTLLKSGIVAIRDMVMFADKSAKIALYGYNDTLTFSNLTVTDDATDNRNYKPMGDMIVKGGNWSENDGKIVVDATTSAAFGSAAIIRNGLADKSYRLSADVTANNLQTENTVGLLVWYKNNYNYLYAYVTRDANGAKIGFNGVVTTEIGSVLTQRIIDQSEAYIGGDFTSLSVVKRSAEFSFTAGTQTVSVSVDEMLDAADYGLTAAGMKATFGNVSVGDVDYNQFDVVSDNFGGDVEYIISAKEQNSVSYADGKFTFASDAVDASGNKNSYVMWQTSFVDNLRVVANFDVAANGVYGLYAWYNDSENYILVTVTNDGLVVNARFGANIQNKTYPLAESFVREGTHTLQTSVVLDELTVLLDGTEIAQLTVLGANKTLSPKAGIVASVAETTVSQIAVDGFTPGDTVNEGNWELRGGAHADTWTIDNDKIVGKLDGGTSWMNTMALTKANGKKDFYMSASVLVNAVDKSEYKTGLVPYYVDGNNYVFVWLSKWADGSPCIVVTARINGVVIGSEWREQQTLYNYIGEVNYLEVQIDGDNVLVYLNKSFNATYRVTFDGLSNRNTDNSYVGFNISNTSATFGNITAQSDVRKFVLTEKPVITLVTKPVSTGKVGTKVKLPICSATNSANETLTATIKVVGPDGKEVEVKTGSFTPTAAGSYTVTVSCKDLWGNEAEPIVYTVTVEADKPAHTCEHKCDKCGKCTDKDCQEDVCKDKCECKEEKKGCFGVVASSSVAAFVLLVSAAAVVAKRKKD